MASFAEQQLARIEATLAALAGAKSMTIDGRVVTFDDLTAQWTFWSKRVAAATGTGRPLTSQIDLSRG